MENYVKALLYFYPMMRSTERNYGEYIRNKAIMSYDNRVPAETTVEKILEEIIKKKKFEELTNKLTSVMKELNLEDKVLLEFRYFRRKKVLKKIVKNGLWKFVGSKRNYFRRQNKLEKKIYSILIKKGLTEKEFLDNYAELEEIKDIVNYIESRQDRLDGKENVFLDKMYALNLEVK